MSGRLSRIPLALLCIAGAVLAGVGAVAAAGGSERAVHVLGGLRWPGVLVGIVGAFAGAAWSAVELRGAAAPPRPRVARDVFVVLVAVIAIQALFSRDFKPVLYQLTCAAGTIVFVGIRALDTRVPAWRGPRPLRILETLLFQLALLAVLVEVALRTLAFVAPGPLFARDASGVEEAMAMYRVPPGKLRYGFPCNSAGHYDDEFAPGARKTVVAIGDSFSMGVVPHAYHYTTVAERSLPGVAIHNLGRPGIGPGGYLWLLEHEGLDLKPDLILLCLFVGNDVEEARRWNRGGDVLGSICDRRNLLSIQVPVRLLRLMGEPERSGTVRMVAGVEFDTRLEDAAAIEKAMPWIRDPTRERPSLSVDQFLRIESKRATALQRADRDGSYDLLFGALAMFRERAGDTPVALLLIPDQFQVDGQLWAEVCRRNPGRDLDRDGAQRRILEWARARKIPCLDLLPVLRAIPKLEDGQRHLYHLRDTHFNVRGNAAAARALIPFLQERWK